MTDIYKIPISKHMLCHTAYIFGTGILYVTRTTYQNFLISNITSNKTLYYPFIPI